MRGGWMGGGGTGSMKRAPVQCCNNVAKQHLTHHLSLSSAHMERSTRAPQHSRWATTLTRLWDLGPNNEKLNGMHVARTITSVLTLSKALQARASVGICTPRLCAADDRRPIE